MKTDFKNSLFLLVFLSLWLSVSSTMAQTKRVAEAIKKIPFEGRTIKDFAPKGWEVYGDASGDLNGDNIPDAALTLTLPIEEAEKLKEAGGDEYESAPSIIVVLFGKPNGGFRRFAVNGRLYPPDSDYRSYLDNKIEKGVLVINTNWGDGWAKDITFRFRYDAVSAKLMLIGFDQELYNRADNLGSGSKSSENYLTGIGIDYEKKRSGSYAETKRTKISRAIVTFEQAHFSEKEGGELRPF